MKKHMKDSDLNVYIYIYILFFLNISEVREGSIIDYIYINIFIAFVLFNLYIFVSMSCRHFIHNVRIYL